LISWVFQSLEANAWILPRIRRRPPSSKSSPVHVSFYHSTPYSPAADSIVKQYIQLADWNKSAPSCSIILPSTPRSSRWSLLWRMFKVKGNVVPVLN
jgi:hypothetical protein